MSGCPYLIGLHHKGVYVGYPYPNFRLNVLFWGPTLWPVRREGARGTMACPRRNGTKASMGSQKQRREFDSSEGRPTCPKPKVAS